MPEPEDDEPGRRRPADELRRIARYHRWVVAAVLAQLTLWGGYLALSLARGNPPGGALGFPTALTLILGCVGGIYAFLIYWSVRDPFWAAVMGLASVAPGFGLLALVVVNGTATRALEADGVKVGLFGADADAIADDRAIYEDEDW